MTNILVIILRLRSSIYTTFQTKRSDSVFRRLVRLKMLFSVIGWCQWPIDSHLNSFFPPKAWMQINQNNTATVWGVWYAICDCLLFYQFPYRSRDTQPKSQVLPTVRLLGITQFPWIRWNMWPLRCSRYQGEKVIAVFQLQIKVSVQNLPKSRFLAALFSSHSSIIRNWIGCSFFERTYRKRIFNTLIPFFRLNVSICGDVVNAVLK
jgi:hypothetical protein